MQIKSSLKQLWAESRANPGFTSLYIGGVAFAVAFTMVYAIVYYVHLAPIYPEYNRSTTAYISNITVRNEKNAKMMQGPVGLPFFEKFVSGSENLEYYSIMSFNAQSSFIQPPDQSPDIKVIPRLTDSNFFKIYDYEFIAGHAFDDADVDAGIKAAVIDESLATRLYGSPEKALGENLSLDFDLFRIKGVVRDGTPVAYNSYANVIVPYTVYFTDAKEHPGDMRNLLGSYLSTIKFSDNAQAGRFREELTDKVRRYNASDTSGWVLDIQQAPLSHTMKILSRRSNGEDISMTESLKPLLFVLLTLLIIPAINISGIISGQMDRRIAEIGVRRSFGATRHELTRGVMTENFILTLIGGIIGLMLAWIVIISSRKWILTLIIPSWELAESSAENLTSEMLISPAIFLFTIIICLVLNMLSAYIPVRLSLRQPIVSSLNSKR